LGVIESIDGGILRVIEGIIRVVEGCKILCILVVC